MLKRQCDRTLGGALGHGALVGFDLDSNVQYQVIFTGLTQNLALTGIFSQTTAANWVNLLNFGSILWILP